ncbi:uncharacterized protein LOC111409441 [Olea europaea var. sylvestris]|uniref:uncharacterized protein LOC111409441 n=1 Tax=Olea europaea var. sylvestris TaxID=158386 RepID=UPI000C1D73CC|nr:uncharacterized protein LOC111409441 [Olea europaea var. sylvestris]
MEEFLTERDHEETDSKLRKISSKSTRRMVTGVSSSWKDLEADQTTRMTPCVKIQLNKLPNPEQIKGKKYCKWHNAWSHLTNNCLVFRHVLQDAIESGRITFDDKKKMAMNENPFPQPLGINMVTSGFKNKLPKFKLVIDEGEEDPRPHPSVFERIKGKEPKKDKDVLCARCKREVNGNIEKPGTWQHPHPTNPRETTKVS